MWVHETKNVKPGEVDIVTLNGAPFCKTLEEDGLHSYNHDFEIIHVNEDDDIQFLGKVIGYYVEESSD